MADEKTPPALSDEEKTRLFNTGLFFHQAARDPKHRKTLLGVIKDVNPETVIPELDLAAEQDARIDARMKPVLEENARLVKEVETLKSAVGKRTFLDEENISEDELVEVDTLAKEFGITNGKKAVEFWREKQTFGTPRSTPLNQGDADYVEQVRKYAGDARKLKELATAQATKVLREVRGGRISR